MCAAVHSSRWQRFEGGIEAIQCSSGNTKMSNYWQGELHGKPGPSTVLTKEEEDV